MEQRFGVDVTALDFGQGGEAEQAAAWLEERPPENLGPRIVLAKRHTTVPALVLVCRREERISGVSAVTVAGNWFLEAGDVESARARSGDAALDEAHPIHLVRYGQGLGSTGARARVVHPARARSLGDDGKFPNLRPRRALGGRVRRCRVD